MVRINPYDSGGTGGDPNEDDDLDKRKQDSPEDDDSSNEPVTAQTGTLRAATDPMAGAEQYKQKSTAQAGTTVDYLANTQNEDGRDVVAEGNASKGSTMTGVVGTPEGGAVVNSRDGEPISAGPGRDRLASLAGDSGGDTQPESDDPSPSTMDRDRDGSTPQRVQRAVRQRLGGGGGGGLGFPGAGGSGGGGLVDTLTSPAGIVLVVVAAFALTFGATAGDSSGGES